MQGDLPMAHQAQVSAAIRTLAHIYSRRLQSAHIPFERIIVFGSHVRGRAKPWSDVDVCVVSHAFGKDRQGERVRLLSVRNDRTLDIEPHPYNPIDLENPWDPLACEIRKYGITV